MYYHEEIEGKKEYISPLKIHLSYGFYSRRNWTFWNKYKLIHVFLGRQLLVTVNALISCRNSLMKFSFRNITLELNVFNMCRQPNEENENEDETNEQKSIA